MLGPGPRGYEVGRLLGEGAMGRVHEAVRIRDGVRFAAKVLKGDIADAQARRGLVNEAVAAASLHHPNIVEVVDLAEHPDLGVVLITELVDGDPLENNSADLDVETELGYIAQVLEGLTAAHAEGVVHGDLKPSNVLVSRGGIAKLCDFGVAQVLGPTKDGGARRIKAGTPDFMAPEQFEAKATLHPRTDLYAVGVLIYQSLTGASPWQATTMREILGEKLAGIAAPNFDRHGRVVPPSLKQLIEELCAPALESRVRFAREARIRLERARAELGSVPRGRESLPPPSARRRDTTTETELLATRSFDRLTPPKPGQKTRRDSIPAGAVVTQGTGFLHVRSPPLVGREQELLLLREKMLSARTTGRPELVFLVGERGVGKSRLGEWTLAEAERTGTFENAAARFSSDGSTPVRGLRGIIGRLLDPSGGSRLASAFDWLREIGALTPSCDDAAIMRWLTTPTESSVLDAFTASGLALEVVKSLAAVRPVLLWLDDLAHATDGTIELVAAILDQEALSVCVVAASEASAIKLSPSRPRIEKLMQRGRLLELSRLAPQASVSLLRSMTDLDWDAAKEAALELDGLPLTIVSLARDFVSRSTARTGDTAPGEIVWSRSPEEVVARLLVPLARSMGPRFELLLGASLVGGHLTTSLLRAMSARLGQAEVSADLAIDEALLGGVLRVDGGENYRFMSEVVRIRLGELAAAHARKSELYVAAARALTETLGKERPDIVAHAGRLTHAGGDIRAATQMVLEAADVMARGGDTMVARAYSALASRWLREANIGEDDELSHVHGYVEARIRYFSLDYARALEIIVPLLGRIALSTPRNPPLYARVVMLHLRVLFYTDRLRECESGMALAYDELLQETWVIVQLDHLAGHVAALRGDHELAEAHLERGRSTARNGAPWSLQILNMELAELAAVRGDMARARLLLEDAVPLVADVYQVIGMRTSELVVATLGGEARDRQLYVESCLASRRRGDRWRLTTNLLLLAFRDLAFGHPDAERSIVAALNAFEEVPHDESASHAVLTRIGSSVDVPEALRDRATRLLEARRAVGRGSLEG